MAKIIVEININNVSYQELKEELINNPNPEWFENLDPKTGNVSIDEAYLKTDSIDNSFFVFKLLDIKEK